MRFSLVWVDLKSNLKKLHSRNSQLVWELIFTLWRTLNEPMNSFSTISGPNMTPRPPCWSWNRVWGFCHKRSHPLPSRLDHLTWLYIHRSILLDWNHASGTFLAQLTRFSLWFLVSTGVDFIHLILPIYLKNIPRRFWYSENTWRMKNTSARGMRYFPWCISNIYDVSIWAQTPYRFETGKFSLRKNIFNRSTISTQFFCYFERCPLQTQTNQFLCFFFRKLAFLLRLWCFLKLCFTLKLKNYQNLKEKTIAI